MKANPCEGEGRDTGQGQSPEEEAEEERRVLRARRQGHKPESWSREAPDWQMGLTYCAACAQSGVRPGEAAMGRAQTTGGWRGAFPQPPHCLSK